MTEHKEVKILKVSGSSPTRETAGSIVKSYEEGYDIELRAIGASSVNQMYKAIATASSTFALRGRSLLIRPGYDTVKIYDKETEQEVEKTVMIAVIVVQ